MPTKTKRDEEKWDKAKELAEEQGKAETALGALCKRGHDHQGTGRSLRRKQGTGTCVLCEKAAGQRKCQRKSDARKAARLAKLQRHQQATVSHVLPAGTHLGALCLRGHDHEHTGLSLRYAHGACVVCAKARAGSYYTDNTVHLHELAARYRLVHGARIRAQKRRRYWLEREHVLAQNRVYLRSARGKEALRRGFARRRLRMAAQAGVVTEAHKQKLLSQTGGRCPCCGVTFGAGVTPSERFRSQQVWDHRTPLAKGGADADGNLAPICRSCNARKGTMTFEQWRGCSFEDLLKGAAPCQDL